MGLIHHLFCSRSGLFFAFEIAVDSSLCPHRFLIAIVFVNVVERRIDPASLDIVAKLDLQYVDNLSS